MKIKVSESSGPALDWMVAKAAGYSLNTLDLLYDIKSYEKFNPSTNWSIGGAIIEREKIGIGFISDLNKWEAGYIYPDQTGDTPLIAAMRCYVASKLGETVEVPEELCI